MKIQVFDQSTKKPLMNYKLQLQVRGKDSGYISAVTDANGWTKLEDKYKDQQIAQSVQGAQAQFLKAYDGMKLYINNSLSTTGNKQKQPSTTSHK